MRRLIICITGAALIATAAFAQLSVQYKDWAEGPVKHLMTKEEMRQWKAITSDADAKAFIDLFWARRDPTPDTPRNEFQEDFDARVTFADKNFAGPTKRGALTDRGRAFILLGPPEQVSGRAGDQSVSSIKGGGGVTAPTDTAGGLALPGATRQFDRQVWTYAHDKKPKYIQQNDFVLAFEDVGKNDWQLGTTERTNPEQIFMQAVNAFIVNPDLKKPPVYKVAAAPHPVAFKNADLKSAYEQFKAGDKTTVGPAMLTDAEFVSSEGVHFVSAQMYVPAGSEIAAGQKLTYLSVIEDKDGNVVDVREDPVTMIASGNDAYVDKAIELAPGTYTATFALADGGRIISATRTPLTMQGLDPNANSTSPLLLSTNVYPMKTTWRPTDPFMFGGIKVVPKGDATFPTAGDLWYFLEVRNPGLTDQGVPNMRIKVDISGKNAKGAPVAMKFPAQDAEITKLQQEKNRYALGLALPLESFVPGEYTMKVHVTDVVLGKDYDFEKAFKVRG